MFFRISNKLSDSSDSSESSDTTDSSKSSDSSDSSKSSDSSGSSKSSKSSESSKSRASVGQFLSYFIHLGGLISSLSAIVFVCIPVLFCT